MHERRVLAALLRRRQGLFRFVKQFLIEEFACCLCHLPMRMIDKFVDVFTILVLQNSFVESNRRRDSYPCLSQLSLLQYRCQELDGLHSHFVLTIDRHLNHAILEWTFTMLCSVSRSGVSTLNRLVNSSSLPTRSVVEKRGINANRQRKRQSPT